MPATKILFHSPNILDTATLTASSENADFPVDNLKDEQRSIVYRSNAVTDMNIVIDHTSAVAMSEFLIINHNIPQTGTTITIQRHTADSWATPDFSETVTWHAGIIIRRFTSNTKRYTRLRIQTSGSAVKEIGRLILCVARTPNINYSWGFRKRKIDYSEVVESAGHQFFTNLKSQVREYEFGFLCKAADIVVLEAFFTDVGQGRHLAISFDHDLNPNTEVYYGRILGPLEYQQDAPDLFRVSTLQFREAT